MSGVVIVDAGEQAVLANGVTGVAYTLRLFVNDVTAGLTPSQVDQLDVGDFAQATFTGYAAQPVATGGWTVTQGNPTVARNAEKTFTSTAAQAPQLVWGYHVTRTSDGILVWFEQFDGPIVVENSGDEIRIRPTLTLDDVKGNAVETGTVTFFGGAAAPAGWLLCNGAAVSRSTFADLFAVVGTTYGPGDGSTTFNVPDLRQRFPLGKAAAGTGSTLGGNGGQIDHVHGLGNPNSGAAFDTPTTPAQPLRWSRRAVTAWTANVQTSSTHGLVGSFASNGNAVALVGDTQTQNPPYLTLNAIVKT